MSSFIKLISIILIAASLIAGWALMDYQSFQKTPVIDQQPVILEIEKGESFRKITDKLIQKGVDINPVWFRLMAYQKDQTQKIKTGEFVLNPGITPTELLAILVVGKSKQYAITFPEGWTFTQIRDEIEKNPNIKQTLKGLDVKTVLKQIGVKEAHPEGLFFPDTYYFEKNMTDVALLKRAYQKMHQVLEQEWQNREKNLPLKSAYEALILASIIEKETGKVSERPTIAGVFIRRLGKGMLLQTDPTVIYGMGKAYKGNIRYKDLKKPTPYNTYVIKGLPPTPIAMPGKAAIHAALHPESGDSLYFVSRGDGSHVFSATLSKHNKAVNIYQRKK